MTLISPFINHLTNIPTHSVLSNVKTTNRDTHEPSLVLDPVHR
jgi:hypothetical protein